VVSCLISVRGADTRRALDTAWAGADRKQDRPKPAQPQPSRWLASARKGLGSNRQRQEL